MSDDDLRKEIATPATSKLKEVGRTALVQLASAGVGRVASVIDKVVPSTNGAEQKRWQGEITDRANLLGQIVADLQDTVHGKVVLTGLTATIAIYLAQSSRTGMPGRLLDIEGLAPTIPVEASDEEIRDALAELEELGLIYVAHALGGAVAFQPAESFFEFIDPPVMGIPVQNNAAELAQKILDGRGEFDGAAALQAAIGWPPRIFNPALARIKRMMPGCYSKERQAIYPTSQIFSSFPKARLALRRLAAEYRADLSA